MVFKFNSFQTRLFITYSLFLVMFTLIISIPMYLYLKENIVNNTTVGVKQIVNSIIQNLDHFSTEYGNITKELYINKNIINAMESLANPTNETEKLKSNRLINNSILVDSSIYMDTYRINIFTSNGIFFSNKPSDVNMSETFFEGDLIETVRQAAGAVVIEYDDNDRWLANGRTPVYSFIRQLQSERGEVGFLEMQVNANVILALDKVINSPNTTLTVLNGKKILYPIVNKDNAESIQNKINYYLKMAGNARQGSSYINNNGKEYVVFQSSETGYYVFYSILEKELFSTIRYFRVVAILIIFLLISFSVLLFYFLSKFLTYPLKKLKRAIDSINLADKRLEIENKYNMDEIELINRSFSKMNSRLQSSLEEIIQFKTLQLQSHFETLQAQINPHFLFNMLGVIAILAEKEGNKIAADVSRKLAFFLRYTINTNDSLTTLQKEITFVTDYLELMKYRYTHRLHFQINIPSSLTFLEIPKLTLQPLVENCIQHGFDNIDREMTIIITAKVVDNCWEITISDNGSGFNDDVLLSINERIEIYQQNLDAYIKGEKLSLGGMGLISSFARLKVLHKDKLTFTVGNNKEEGAFITIGWIIKNKHLTGVME